MHVTRQLGVDDWVIIHHSRDAREGEDERSGAGPSYYSSPDDPRNSIPFYRFTTLRNTVGYAWKQLLELMLFS